MASKYESRNNTWPGEKPKQTAFVRPLRPVSPAIEGLRNREATPEATTAARPRCIKSYRSDRMAIYDEERDSFHAYSVTEAISQPGLSFQEAVDWVDERLVLVGNGMSAANFTVAAGLVAASWAVAILMVLGIFKLIF